MNDKENDIIYTAQDIDAYVLGKLTPLQMHAMEKAALDDDFLAEAMEGYAIVKSDNWKDELATLKTTFENKEPNKAIVVAMPKRNNNWWKVAAAVVLLSGAATISYLAINKNNKGAIAKNIPVENKTAHTTAIPDTVLINTDAVNGHTESLATAQPPITKQRPNTITKPSTALPNTEAADVTTTNNNTAPITEKTGAAQNFVYTPQKQTRYDSVAMANKYRDADGRTDYFAKKTMPAAPPVAYNSNPNGYTQKNTYNNTNTNAATVTPNNSLYETFKDKNNNTTTLSKAKEETLLNHNFRAQVLSADDTPLPFANISIKGENFGTYADVKGYFNLISTDSLLTVEVKAAGYQSKFYTLQSFIQQNKIVMAEDNAAYKYQKVEAKSADVAARNRVSRKATLLKDSVVNVEPADGWDNYNTYVNNNIEIPEDILTKDIHGQVELSFDVKSNGTIANIKVDKSLCDNCDELAKRLIQQGPQWKVKKGKKGKGKVTVQF